MPMNTPDPTTGIALTLSTFNLTLINSQSLEYAQTRKAFSRKKFISKLFDGSETMTECRSENVTDERTGPRTDIWVGARDACASINVKGMLA